MKKLMLSWTLGISVAGLTFMSCGKDKDDTKPENPAESTFKDPRDSKVYKTIKIGDHTWFAENLRYAGPVSAGYINDSYGDADSTKKYGPLYTWEAANLVCPMGWHLPSDSDWKTLEHNLGMVDSDLEKIGFSQKRGVDQKLGTRLQVGGDIGFNFVIMAADTDQDTWTSSDYDVDKKYIRSFSRKDNSVYRATNGFRAPLCVRCLKD